MPSRHWKMALCSLSTGRTRRPDRFAVAMTSSPAMTRISLLATARSLPDSSAFSAGRRPAVPTMAMRTMSASGREASSSSPRPPWRMSRPGSNSPTAFAAFLSPAQSVAVGNSRASSSRRCALFLPERAMIPICSGNARATRIVLSPMDPVAPRTTTRLFIMERGRVGPRAGGTEAGSRRGAS